MGSITLDIWERFYERVVKRSSEWPRNLWLAAVEDGLRAALPAQSRLLAHIVQDVAALGELERAGPGSYRDSTRMAQLEADIMRLIGLADQAIREDGAGIEEPAEQARAACAQPAAHQVLAWRPGPRRHHVVWRAARRDVLPAAAHERAHEAGSDRAAAPPDRAGGGPARGARGGDQVRRGAAADFRRAAGRAPGQCRRIQQAAEHGIALHDRPGRQSETRSKAPAARSGRRAGRGVEGAARARRHPRAPAHPGRRQPERAGGPPAGSGPGRASIDGTPPGQHGGFRARRATGRDDPGAGPRARAPAGGSAPGAGAGTRRSAQDHGRACRRNRDAQGGALDGRAATWPPWRAGSNRAWRRSSPRAGMRNERRARRAADSR